MAEPLNILVIEDRHADFLMVERHLRQGGLSVRCSRVDSLQGLHEAIDRENWDLVLSDYSIPHMNFLESLHLVQERLPELPLILVSGSIGEEKAIELLKMGVWDFVLKESLTRLVPTIERSLKEMAARRARKAAETALLESNDRFRMIFEHSIDAIMLTRIDGSVLAANPAACRLFAMSEEEICRAGHTGLVDMTDERTDDLLRQLLLTGHCQGEITMMRGDGSRFPAEISSAVFADRKGVQKTSLVIRDITERKSLENQLLQAQKMEAIGTLAGGIAHDFNNILTAVIGYSTLLQMELRTTGKPQEYIDNLMALVDRATNLTRGLLAFSRNQPMSPKLVDLNDVISAFTRLISRLIGEHIVVETHLAATPLTIMADSGQIEQALMNLATNARDAMAGGGKLIIATDVVTLDPRNQLLPGNIQPGPYALLSVSDTGSGMDEATAARIFEPFFTTKKPGTGTGLGLSILYGIIKQHNGLVAVASRPGAGTTFTIHLPLAATADATAPNRGYGPVAGGTETILLAEDDHAIRTVVSNILQQFGYRVIEAADGEEAVTSFRRYARAVSLVILDAMMPRQNANEAFSSILQIRPDAKALFVSGYPADLIAQRGLLPEGAAFLPKPVSPMDLLRCIRQLLDGHDCLPAVEGAV